MTFNCLMRRYSVDFQQVYSFVDYNILKCQKKCQAKRYCWLRRMSPFVNPFTYKVKTNDRFIYSVVLGYA